MNNLTNAETEALEYLEEFLKRIEMVNLIEGLHLDMKEAKQALEVLTGDKIDWQGLD